MAITKLKHHNKCECVAVKNKSGVHFARLICLDHHVIVQHLSRKDYYVIKELAQ